MPRFGLVFFALFSLTLNASNVFGQSAGDVFACKSSDTIQLLRRLQQQNDGAAVRKLQDDSLRSGDCTMVPGNSLTFVAAVDNNEVAMVRQKGGTLEVWALTSSLPPGVFPGR